MNMFKKAERNQKKLRLAMAGVSGSGKTYSALRIATGISKEIGKPIAFIDTEHGAASIYANEFTFDKVDLTNETPIPEYIKAIKEAGIAGYGVLIIDSMSHPWESLLDTVDMVANAKYRGNSWSAWGDKNAGKLYDDFINAILASPCHIIACFRVKTQWEVTKDSDGKTKPIKIGLTPQQRANIEYEFDMFMEGDITHTFIFNKSRISKFQDVIVNKPSEELGISILKELNEGKAVEIDMLANERAAIAKAASIDELTRIYNSSPFQDLQEFRNMLSERKQQLLSNAKGMDEL